MSDSSVERDVVFASPDGDLRCDIYRPAGQARGVALLLHGGGLRGGSPAMMADFGALLAERGWCAVAPQYRLLPDVSWPVPVHDVKSAVRWVRASSDRFGDASRTVALVGFSAGALLSLLVEGTADSGAFRASGAHGEQSEHADAVVAFFSPIRVEGFMASMMGVEGGGAREASPIEQISDRFPPTLLLHGTGDTLIPHAASVELFEALHARGVPVDLRLYAGQPHEFQRLPGMAEVTAADVAAFLDRHLLYREEFEAERAELQARWDEMARARAGARGGAR